MIKFKNYTKKGGVLLDIRAVTHILNSNDEKSKAIKEILDLFLPRFKNLDKDTPILINLPAGFSPSIIGTGVSVLSNLYFELNVVPKKYLNEGKEYIAKGVSKDFEHFMALTPYLDNEDLEKISSFKSQLENAEKIFQITPELFMMCVILETYKRCGMFDLNLLKVSDDYYHECATILNLLLNSIKINDSIILNPIFGCEEHMLKGDGDFILNGSLIDIKTSKSIVVDKNARRQLLFYYLLNHRRDSLKSFKTKYPISKLYVYKARHGRCIEVPFNLRGVNPLYIIEVISAIEAEKIVPDAGIELIKCMLKSELNPKSQKLKSKPKKVKEKKHIFKIKKVFVCIETGEIFNNVVEANKKYGFSKNSIYRNLNGERKCTTTKYGDRLTWKVMYKIV